MQTFVASDKRRMYGDLAWTWPIINPHEDFVGQADGIARLLESHAGAPIYDVLHLGCGGGNVDYNLKNHFRVTGVDISDDMLHLARQLNSDLVYEQGDMRSVRLGKQFDAVIMLESIGYMRTTESLRAAFKTAASHLRSGGIILAMVEETRENFIQNRTESTVHSRGEVEIVLVRNSYDPDQEDSWYEVNFIYLIRRSGELAVEADCHLRGLFDLETWKSIISEHGLVPHEESLPTITSGDRHRLTLIGSMRR